MEHRPFAYVAGLALPLEKRRAGETCVRIHRSIHDPRWFNRDAAGYRFNAPNGVFGVCYLGLSFEVALAETLPRNPESRLLAREDLAVRSVSTGRLARAITLVQLHGPGLARLRITAELLHGPHEACRQLALELWGHRRLVDGIAYRSRFDNDEICVALFDRAADALAFHSTEELLADERRLGRTLDRYRVGLDP